MVERSSTVNTAAVALHNDPPVPVRDIQRGEKAENELLLIGVCLIDIILPVHFIRLVWFGSSLLPCVSVRFVIRCCVCRGVSGMFMLPVLCYGKRKAIR